MSASTVSITNPSRRLVEKKPTDTGDLATDYNFTGTVSPAADKATFGGDASIRTTLTGRDVVVQVRKHLPSTAANARRTQTQTPPAAARKPSSKIAKPWWMTVISVITKNLLLVLVLWGFFQIGGQLMLKNGASTEVDLVPGDYKGNMEKVDEFMRSTAKSMHMMQMQVDVLDRKIGDEIGSVKREVDEKIEGKGMELEAKLKELDGRSVNFENFMSDWGGKMDKWLSKDELNEFIEELKKTKSGDAVTLDEVRVFARGIVEREIEKHAADGIGRVDYALSTAGGLVIKHSEAYIAGGLLSGNAGIKFPIWQKLSSDSEKMLRPSFGEPGQCFPLKGSNGFVHIRLRTAITPEAVTLEHVDASVAYDRSSAPKDCRVSGWLERGDSIDSSADPKKTVLLTEFKYDLEKSNIQTFDVVDSAHSSVVNLIKFEFTSNHGSPSHTCIYRLRVHGHEPNPNLMLTPES